VLASRGQVVEAAQAFERVLELFPAHPDAHYNLAQLLLVNGRPKEAAEHLAAVVRVVPEHTMAWERLGEAQLQLGERAAARAALERAIRDPSRADAARLLAGLLARAPEPELCDPPRALELARRAAAATQRRDPRALEVLALALAANGDFARAAEVEEEGAALLPSGHADGARARAAAYRRNEMPPL
jgi:tetratricopeptide (TPR) repeat protein